MQGQVALLGAPGRLRRQPAADTAADALWREAVAPSARVLHATRRLMVFACCAHLASDRPRSLCCARPGTGCFGRRRRAGGGRARGGTLPLRLLCARRELGAARGLRQPSVCYRGGARNWCVGARGPSGARGPPGARCMQSGWLSSESRSQELAGGRDLCREAKGPLQRRPVLAALPFAAGYEAALKM